MDAHAVEMLIVAGGAALGVVWVLHKIGKALAAVLEALATLAMVLVALWLVFKAGFWLIKLAVYEGPHGSDGS